MFAHTDQVLQLQEEGALASVQAGQQHTTPIHLTMSSAVLSVEHLQPRNIVKSKIPGC